MAWIDDVTPSDLEGNGSSSKLVAGYKNYYIDALDYRSLANTASAVTWKRCNDLTWNITDLDNSTFNLQEVLGLIKIAFERWCKIVNLKCTYKDAPGHKANIRFSLGRWNSDRHLAFAHVVAPGNAEIVINANVDWEFTAQMTNRRKFNFLYAILHEIGHAIGIDHSNENRDIMFPFYRSQRPDNFLSNNDLELAIQIYGRRIAGGNDPEVEVVPRNPPPEHPPVQGGGREREDDGVDVPPKRPPTEPKPSEPTPDRGTEREGAPGGVPTKEMVKRMIRLFKRVSDFFDEEKSRLQLN